MALVGSTQVSAQSTAERVGVENSAADPTVATETTRSSPGIVRRFTAPIATTTENASRAGTFSRWCTLSGDKDIPEGFPVVVVGQKACRSSSGNTERTFYEVYLAGTRSYMDPEKLNLDGYARQQVAAITDEERDANDLDWRRDSLSLAKGRLEKAIAKLRPLEKLGVGILESKVYEPRFGVTTGYRVRIYNPTKKTFKYVTFTVIGYNAVNDPVVDRVKRTATLSFRGIGPVEPDATATWSDDRLWFTDVVETHRLVSIKVEFMDGTIRTVTNTAAAVVDREAWAVIETPLGD